MPQEIHAFPLVNIILVAFGYRLLQLDTQLFKEKLVRVLVAVFQKTSCSIRPKLRFELLQQWPVETVFFVAAVVAERVITLVDSRQVHPVSGARGMHGDETRAVGLNCEKHYIIHGRLQRNRISTVGDTIRSFGVHFGLRTVGPFLVDHQPTF